MSLQNGYHDGNRAQPELPMTYTTSQDMLKESPWMGEAMDAANTGLWVIILDTRSNTGSMLANAPMLRLLGMEEHPSPEECFTFWRSRVDKKYDDDVNEVVAQFLADAQMHEVRYPYHHPHWGSIFVRCGGPQGFGGRRSRGPDYRLSPGCD